LSIEKPPRWQIGVQRYAVAMLRILALCCLLSFAWCGESLLDPAEARWTAAVTKASQGWTAAVAKTDATVLREAERTAISAVRKNDPAAATAAWSEILRIDRGNQKAREALTALGQLDPVSTALAGEAGDDLLGNGAPQSNDSELRKAIERRTKTVADETASRDAAYAKADAVAVAEFERLAVRAVGRGDLPGVSEAWYAVLRLSREHAKAREFFTASGRLASVLAELEQAGDPHRVTMSVRGAAAAFICNQRTISGRAGQWTVEDAAGGKPMTVGGMTEAPRLPWLTLDGSITGSLPDPTLLRTLPFSVALWLRPQGPQVTNAGILSDYVSGSWNGFLIQFEGGSITSWYLRDRGNRVSYCTELDGKAGVPAASAVWTHVVVTVDDKELILYGAGKLVGRSPWMGKAGSTSSAIPLMIGRFTAPFRGDIASILLWKRVLTAPEVADVMAETAPSAR